MQNQEYLDFFNKNIQLYIKEFENIRQNYLALYVFVYGLMIFLWLLIWCFLSAPTEEFQLFAKFFLCCWVVIIFHPIACMMVTRYRSVIKDRFLRHMLKCLYGLKYYNPNPTIWTNIAACNGMNTPENHINSEELYALKAVNFFGSINFDDYIKGKYKDLCIEIQELSLSQNMGRSTHVMMFHGLIMSVEFNKKLQDRILFFSDKTLEQHSKCTKGVKIETEDVEFNKMFNIYSKDQIEARYVFTPVFMEKIKEIAKQNPQYKINGEFYNGKLYIIISSAKNWFEIPFFKSTNNPMIYYQPINDLQNLLSLIDVLKLEQNIGL